MISLSPMFSDRDLAKAFLLLCAAVHEAGCAGWVEVEVEKMKSTWPGDSTANEAFRAIERGLIPKE